MVYQNSSNSYVTDKIKSAASGKIYHHAMVNAYDIKTLKFLERWFSEPQRSMQWEIFLFNTFY